jgi:hypothetical protein
MARRKRRPALIRAQLSSTYNRHDYAASATGQNVRRDRAIRTLHESSFPAIESTFTREYGMLRTPVRSS